MTNEITLSSLLNVETEVELIRTHGVSNQLLVNGVDYSHTYVSETDSVNRLTNTESGSFHTFGFSYDSTGNYFQGDIYECFIEYSLPPLESNGVVYNLNSFERSLSPIIGLSDFTINFTNVTNPGNFDEFLTTPKNGETWDIYYQYGIHLFWYKYNSVNHFRIICNDSAIDFGNPSTPFTGTIEVKRQNNTLTVWVNGANISYTVLSEPWLGSGGTTGFFASIDRPNIVIGNTLTSGTIGITY
jgi:hypothetical protein